MLNHLLQVASGLDCNMESLISNLQRRYSLAAAASSVVSQAALLHSMSEQSRQMLALTPTIQPEKLTPIQTGHQSESQGRMHRNTSKQPTAQYAPLDLSVKQTCQTNNQTTKPRHLHHKRQALPLDLVKTETQINRDQQIELDLNNNASALKKPVPIKLISSSTSPTTDDESLARRMSASSSRISSSSPSSDVVNNGPTDTCCPSLHATDVISSTNGRRLKRKSKKQKTSKSHLCNHCGRSFSRSDMLTRHSRLHSGLKPYQCGKCFQVFSRSDHLSTHERTHTGEKPYQCGICAYSACRRDMITRHMRTHLGQRVKSRTRSRRLSIDACDVALNSRTERRQKRNQKFASEHAKELRCDDDELDGDDGNGDFIL